MMIDVRKLIESALPMFELICNESGIYLAQYCHLSLNFDIKKDEDGKICVTNVTLIPMPTVGRLN